MAKKHPRETPPPEPAADPEGRRNFAVEIGAVVIGALAALGPLAIGLFSFLDPLRGSKRVPKAYSQGAGGQDSLLRIASLDALPVGDPPRRFQVIANKVDAWNFVPHQPIGAVYVQRLAEQDVRVFNVTCPHAGCSVACDGQGYHCPCHNSSFNLDGTKRVSESGRENPSPRAMDELEVAEDKLAQGEIWVNFKNFYTGIEEKIPKA